MSSKGIEQEAPSSSGGGGTTTTTSLLNQPIVMDVGTDTTKAGFAGGAKPKVRHIDTMD